MGELWTDHISFSQLATVTECPYSYYLQKIVGIESVENAFAQAGAFAHELLACWARGEIAINNLAIQWAEKFSEKVTSDFPHYLASKGFAEKLFNNILHYFEGFEGFPGYEIIGVEKQFHSSIAGEPFIGVVDLILRNKETGGLMLVDHKSCSLSSFKKNKEQMYRQLLLYSKYCADQYGEFPEKLRFNLFKEGVYDERLFDCEEYVAARLWAESIIQEIKTKDITDWFMTRPEYFRCVNLCNGRNECMFGKPENHKRKDSIHENRLSTVT